MTFFKMLPLTSALLVSAAAVPAAADTFSDRLTWRPFAGATVKPVASVNRDGYMAGLAFRYDGEASVGDNPLYWWVTASYLAGHVDAGESQFGNRQTDVFAFGRKITVEQQAALAAGLRYPYHPHRQWLASAGLTYTRFHIKEDFFLFDLVKGDTASDWALSWYISLGHQWYVASQEAIVTATLQYSEGVNPNDLRFPISTGTYEWAGPQWRAELDYQKPTSWGSWGGHIAATHDDDGWAPEIGVRASKDFGLLSLGPVDFTAEGFASATIVKYDDYTDGDVTLGVNLAHGSGLTTTLGASWNQDDQWKVVVGAAWQF